MPIIDNKRGHMSRRIRKKLFERLQILEEATRELHGTWQKEKFLETEQEEYMNLLLNCQECAIAIGEQIDKVYPEAEGSIHALEDYCEKIYKLAQKLSEKDVDAIYDEAYGQILVIRKQMEEELPDKLEMVFLPYKAAMWDSLESIWLEASKDEACNTYVVPVPYYDKRPDGSLGEMHYEGMDYPAYVPVTDYERYNPAERQPDVIFIHNPYDGGNSVTSVHPYFYAKNLKQFTDKLIYVPYFVLDGNWIDASLVLTAGTIYADYVVVRTEKEKECYLNHLREHYPQLAVVDKFLPFGSPKIDKVRQICLEGAEIPHEWKNRVKGKKVVLYNTGVVGVLNSDEQYLEKLKNVFEYAKRKEDMVLLWRPHPLMEATLKSKRPELYEEYLKIKNYFLQESVGIYDTKADMYPAIGISNIYYGDWSSLIWLYQESGKGVRVQNMHMMNEEIPYYDENMMNEVVREEELSCGRKIYLFVQKLQ